MLPCFQSVGCEDGIDGFKPYANEEKIRSRRRYTLVMR
jgi:hypothetical protein